MIITIDNTWIKLNSFPPEIMKRLYSECRYRQDGYMYSMQYRKGYWDGYTYLLSKSTDRARSGLTDRIIRTIASEFPDYKYLLSDLRTINNETKKQFDIDINFTPRDYQLDMAELVIDKSKSVVELPTGTGKTKLAAYLISKIGQPSIFVAPNLLLLYQTHEAFSNDLNCSIGIVGDGNCIIPSDTKIIVCTAQTLSRILLPNQKKKKSEYDTYMFERISSAVKYEDFINFLKKTKLLIWDEVHHTAADLYYLATEKLPQISRIYGLSATPYRKDGATMKIEAASGASLTLKDINRSYKSLFDDNILCKPKIITISITKSDDITIDDTYQSAYKKQIVLNRSRNRLIADYALRHKKTVIAVNRIEQGRAIADELGSNAVECYASSDDLYKKFKKWKSGKVKILISTLVDEGFDVPDVDCLIVASPCSDITQQIGRAIRMHPTKKDAFIYVINDESKHFRQLNAQRIESYTGKFPEECYK